MVSDRLNAAEKDIAKKLKDWVKEYDIYTEWLDDVGGIGPTFAAALIGWLDSESPTYGKGFTNRFETISKLWAYAGLAVNEETGHAVRRKKGQKTNWNPRLKSLCWKIGESFVKCGKGYRELYEQFRAEYDRKWITSEDCGSKGCANKGKIIKSGPNKGKHHCQKGHRYAAAKRKAVKVFLAHLYKKWYELEGKKPRKPYIIAMDNNHTTEIPIVEE